MYRDGRLTSLAVTPASRRKDIIDHSTASARVQTMIDVACADRNWLFHLPPMLDGLPTPGPVTKEWITAYGESLTGTRGTFWPGYLPRPNPVRARRASRARRSSRGDQAHRAVRHAGEDRV
ncbi:MAG: hypothetical protein U1G05_13025 [Kiritimatiellia bacterium]